MISTIKAVAIEYRYKIQLIAEYDVNLNDALERKARMVTYPYKRMNSSLLHQHPYFFKK